MKAYFHEHGGDIKREPGARKLLAKAVGNGRISKYTVTARPRRFYKDGVRSFFIDETGIIRFTGENRAATAQDPSL